MQRRTTWGVSLLVVLALVGLPGPAVGAGVDREDFFEPFIGDVFVIDGVSLRNPTIATPDDAPLFDNVGAALGVTWGEWRSATVTSMAVQIGGPARPMTDVRLRFGGLIPEGIYSIFYTTLGPDSAHPLCPGILRAVPLTSLHGERQRPDASSFVADPLGQGSYHGRVDGALLDADEVFMQVIYHFDEQTWHPFANSGQATANCHDTFGFDAMRQIVLFQKHPGSP